MSKKEAQPSLMAVNKITLPSGKVVLVREIELGDEENATKIAARKSGDQAMGMAMGLITEVTKLVIFEVDGHKLTANDRLAIEKFLPYKEFVMVRRIVEQLMGETGAEPMVEFVPSGQP